MKKVNQHRVKRLFEIGKYSCLPNGTVLSFSNKHGGFRSEGRPLSFSTSGTRPYPRVALVEENGTVLSVLVHNVVYLFFKGYFDPDLEIDHLDSNIDNSAINNLELVTRTENNRRRRPFHLPRCLKTGRYLKCKL